MKQKITISLDAELITFLDGKAQGNRSDYLNSLLKKQRQQELKAELITALQQDAEDSEYLTEAAAWDSVVGDGINAAG